MRHFLIKYRLQHGSADDWHRQIAEFVSTLDIDPDLQGRISYRVLTPVGGDDYYHLATAMDGPFSASSRSGLSRPKG